MKRSILISIHPEHVKNILRGVKRFELRRKIPTNVERIVIYSTAPESRIVAIAKVEEIIRETPVRLWKRVRGAAGVSELFFHRYFGNCNEAFALRIGRVQMISKPIFLNHPRLKLSPPQSFRYLDDKTLEWLEDSSDPMCAAGTRKIFIGGVHASGKDFLCKNVISSFGYHCISASEIIKMADGEVLKTKAVSSVSSNQEKLLLGLRRIQGRNTHLAINGHFCLIDKEGKVRKVSLKTFEAINPELIVLAYPSTSVVESRLARREDKIYIKEGIEDFMEKERKHAIFVANKLSVPIKIIDTGLDCEQLYEMFAKIIVHE